MRTSHNRPFLYFKATVTVRYIWTIYLQPINPSYAAMCNIDRLIDKLLNRLIDQRLTIL